MRHPASVIAVLAAAVGLGAGFQAPTTKPASPTFYRDVLPILQKNCQVCHRPLTPNIGGLVAPMSLMSYDGVRPWARAIVRAVQAKQMPPWLAGPGTKGVFANERGLTDAQIATLTAWESGGAAAGRPQDAPPAPAADERAKNGWTLGEPNLDVAAEPYVMGDDVEEDTVTSEVGELPRDVWVQGIEFFAGSTAVHHICGAAIMPAGTPPGPDLETSLGCSAPGAEPLMLPDGYAFRLPRGAGIRLDVHYHKNKGPGTAVTDQSRIGLTFSKIPVQHRVRFNPAGNTTFEVPPGRADWKVGAARVFETATSLLALWPHGHSRTAAATYWAFYPDGSRELLLDVPRYDYRWQEIYTYRTPKVLPAGTRLEVTYRYDNSPARGGRQGFDASQPVRFGDRAEDEMMLGYVSYVEADASNAPAGPTNAVSRDAVDLDRLGRDTTTMPGRDGIAIEFPRLRTTINVFARIGAPADGTVLQYADSSAMKLKTNAGLQFGPANIRPGNVATGYAGLYGLWLKNTITGWRLVFTNQPDVWGTQFDAATVVVDVPLRYERSTTAADTFTARLDERPGGGHLLIAWGPHQWTAEFVLP